MASVAPRVQKAMPCARVDPRLAEELVLEAVEEIWLRLLRGQEISKPAAYLSGVLARLAAAQRRFERRLPVAPAELLEQSVSPARSTGCLESTEIERETLGHIIDELPEPARTIQLMRFVHGRSNAQVIAALTAEHAVSVGTVAGWIQKANRALREALTRESSAVAEQLGGAALQRVPAQR
jgi:DNA-directed RNA polymerase specialized sigma24 family protein